MKRLIGMPRQLSAFRLILILVSSLCACAAVGAPGDTGSGEPAPPGYSLSHTGDAHDFDYFQGAWTTKQRHLKARGTASAEWEEYPATLCMRLYLDGLATIDELYMPKTKSSGLTVRTFNRQTHQWSIYWATSATGKLDPVAMIGGFQGSHGEFYASDEEDHRPIKVRFLWDKIDHDHARWQQAFSYDNRTWDTNWTAEFTRTDPTTTCEEGRPKRF
jgi:hypothetical protein